MFNIGHIIWKAFFILWVYFHAYNYIGALTDIIESYFPVLVFINVKNIFKRHFFYQSTFLKGTEI